MTFSLCPSKKSFLFLLGAVVLSLAGPGSASATLVTTPGLTLSSDGATFSSFSCTGDCGGITVSPLKPPPTGIEFSTNLSVSGVSSVDTTLAFFVSDPSGVNTIGLSFDSTYKGTEVDSVSEFVYTKPGGPLVGQATVFCSDITDCSTLTSETISLDGTYTNLYVTKDITLASYSAAPSGGSIATITQTFTEVPEPVSVALVGGFLLLGFFSRRLPLLRK